VVTEDNKQVTIGNILVTGGNTEKAIRFRRQL